MSNSKAFHTQISHLPQTYFKKKKKKKKRLTRCKYNFLLLLGHAKTRKHPMRSSSLDFSTLANEMKTLSPFT